MSSIESTIEHVRMRIRQTPIALDPFPHLEVSELLPPEYYSELRRNLPTPDECQEVDAEQNYEFAPMSLHRDGKLQRSKFWLPFATEVSREIMSASLDRMADALDRYMGHMQRQ